MAVYMTKEWKVKEDRAWPSELGNVDYCGFALSDCEHAALSVADRREGAALLHCWDCGEGVWVRNEDVAAVVEVFGRAGVVEAVDRRMNERKVVNG